MPEPDTEPEKRRGRGRPATGESQHLRVRVPEPTQLRLKQTAADRGETVTAIVNRAIDRELRRLDRARPEETP